MKFEFNGRKYRYLDHPANNTRINERRVEIPIIHAELKLNIKKTRILEVGNVMSQYIGRHKWTTVDLVEKEDAVINKDIREYDGGPFDLIISVSTYEHMGVDRSKDRFEAIDAIEHCMNLLVPGGKLYFTVPIGYNVVLDSWLFYRWPGKSRYLLRVTGDNLWSQCGRKIAEGARYGHPYQFANGLVIGEYISPK